MGHMNVQFYFEKALQGCVVLWNKLGINEQPVELGNTDLSLARAHIRFLKEQKPGAPFFLKMSIVSKAAAHWHQPALCSSRTP